MRTVGNLRRRRLWPSIAIIAPALVAALCTAGVVAPPALSVRLAAEENARLTRERGWLAERSALLTRLEQQDGSERIERAIRGLEDLIPRATPELELRSIVMAAAGLSRLTLRSLAVGKFEDPELPRLADELISLRRLRLEAEGSVEAYVHFVETLRALGLPVSVGEFTLDRAGAGYRVGVTLSLFERTEALSMDSSDQDL